MGFKFNNVHSADTGLRVISQSLSLIPSKRSTNISVQGKDGEYVFEDKFDNVIVSLECDIIEVGMITRRRAIREVASLINSTGDLILDSEPDMVYKVVKTSNDIDTEVMATKDTFSLEFECEPYQTNTFYNDNLTWDNATTAWDYLNMPWDGYERIFNFPNPITEETINVFNGGNYESLPLIILSGNASNITIGSFSLTTVPSFPETIKTYVDCKRQIVYVKTDTSEKSNAYQRFSGEFLKLQPGNNEIQITGSIDELIIEFDYKNTFI